MVASVGADTSLGNVRTLTSGAEGAATGVTVRTLYNFPSIEGDVSNTTARTFTAGTSPNMNLTGGTVRVLVRGRVDDPKVRVWTYTMDGHDYYVIRLGSVETLVYDTHSEQWAVYGSGETELWRAFQGINWIGSDRLGEEYGSNVVVGDDGNGSLYFLNPDQYVDDDALEGSEVARTFEREFQGQLVKRGYDYERCYAVELLGSIGKMDVAALTDITLSISDDEGETYTDMGTVTIPNNDYGKRVDWRSLGSFTAPGRMFKITDYGALQRIDSLTVDTDRERRDG